MKSNGVFLKKLIIAFTVIIDDLKLFFRHILLKPYIYGRLNMWLLQTVSRLMADWNVVSNPKFFYAVLHKLSYFFVLNISVNMPFFTHLALQDLKRKHHLMRKFLS